LATVDLPPPAAIVIGPVAALDLGSTSGRGEPGSVSLSDSRPGQSSVPR
jgi:hypothetical protein